MGCGSHTKCDFLSLSGFRPETDLKKSIGSKRGWKWTKIGLPAFV